MLDGPWLLLLLAVLAGGAIAATLLAAFGTRGRREDRDEGMGNWEASSREWEEYSGVEGDFARLAATETRIGKLTQLIELTGKGPSEKGEVLARERVLLAYLVDFADKCSALLLRRSYREQVDWLMSLDEGDWIGKSAAFREKIVHEHGELASKGYFGEHPVLDEALADILVDFDRSTEKLLVTETARLLDDESPIVGAAALRLREDEEALATVIAELDRSFDRFAARLGVR
ncbi:MAG TPA: hypothetical protein VMV83_08780 [Rectinemataceae bacterium]|nr:hypothetical protein [Rectinemataceae bacterium]